jgi:carboxymethylenebutenolidase
MAPTEPPRPLPSAKVIPLAPNASLQPPLSRRGDGPGIVVVDAGLPDSTVEESLDPVPQKKWAEEGYAVARLTYPKGVSIEGQWELETALSKTIEALVDLDTCTTKDKFGLIGWLPIGPRL